MKPKFPIPPYATGRYKIGNVIIVDRDIDFDDNPLFYVNSEYPKYKHLDKRGYLIFDYEFYTDKVGNRYMVVGNYQQADRWRLEELILKTDWNIARNVDTFVENVDKESYQRWLELIS